MTGLRFHVQPSALPKGRRRFDVPGLRHECAELRELCAAKGYASDDELAAYWPGGTENPARDADAWIYCYSQLARFLGRRELVERTREAAREQLEGAVRAAAAAQPEAVPLSVGLHRVYPKSAHALWFLDALGQLCGPLAADALAVLESVPDAVRDQVPWPSLVTSLAVRTWAWILTTPGPGLPFADDATDATPPAWTEQLLPQDLLVLDRAHRQVNAERLRILASAFPQTTDGAGSRLGVAGFLAGYASEHGARASEIVRLWSLGEVFAGAIAQVEAQQLAEARADARAARERPGSPHAARTPRARR